MSRRRAAMLATLLALLTSAAPARAAQTSTTSSNWSGYAAAKDGLSFKKVSATWTVPAVDCGSSSTYSAAWVGLGGYRTTSQALEQAGTEADCTRGGHARYSAWYELVPDVGHDLDLTVRPGDRISTSVAVSGLTVTIRMKDKTRGTQVAKTLRAATVDTTSADWIVEAPALCSGDTANGCAPTELANFGTTRFAHASATSRYGHTGSISDSHWSRARISLTNAPFDDSPAQPPGFVRDQARHRASASATPSALNAAGDSFEIAYSAGA